MVAKKRVRKPSAKDVKAKGTFEVGDRSEPISAGVWGQLEPLDRVAREKTEKWGDTLPSLVSPELAGRFHGAYEALGQAVDAGDVVKTHKLAGALMRAWDVLEQEAMQAGHKPLPVDAYAIDLDGKIVCIASSGVSELRAKHSDWVVYSFEDAARVLNASFGAAFCEEAFKEFPDAKVTRVEMKPVDKVDWDLGGDEIPW